MMANRAVRGSSPHSVSMQFFQGSLSSVANVKRLAQNKNAASLCMRPRCCETQSADGYLLWSFRYFGAELGQHLGWRSSGLWPSASRTQFCSSVHADLGFY
jgi:hypothetical protein